MIFNFRLIGIAWLLLGVGGDLRDSPGAGPAAY
jgi:hypothetical protein